MENEDGCHQPGEQTYTKLTGRTDGLARFKALGAGAPMSPDLVSPEHHGDGLALPKSAESGKSQPRNLVIGWMSDRFRPKPGKPFFKKNRTAKNEFYPDSALGPIPRFVSCRISQKYVCPTVNRTKKFHVKHFGSLIAVPSSRGVLCSLDALAQGSALMRWRPHGWRGRRGQARSRRRRARQARGLRRPTPPSKL
jgi:hypothetical protein